jgi:tetratricopeptide (TPR) repeat protein
MRNQWTVTGTMWVAAMLLATWTGRTCRAEASLQMTSSVSEPGIARLRPEARGDLYLARGEYEQAIEAYQQAPRTAEVWDKMGVAWHHLDAIGEARHDYQRALLIRPNYPEAINNLGATYFAQRNYNIRRRSAYTSTRCGLCPGRR